MTSRERFQETMRYGRPDRVPYFEEGIRDEVLEVWRRQGMPPDIDLSHMFLFDRWEQIEMDLGPRPPFRRWPTTRSELDAWRRRLDP